jgi:hypothetical protein
MKKVEKTYKELLEEVKKDWAALYFVPDALITPEMCMAAVEQDEDAESLIPYKFKYKEK